MVENSKPPDNLRSIITKELRQEKLMTQLANLRFIQVSEKQDNPNANARL